MKLQLILSLVFTLLITGCSKTKDENDKPASTPDKQREVEETAKSILKNRVIMKEQGALTKEEAENAKNMITTSKSTNRRERAIGKEAGGPPASEDKTREEAKAERHIENK